MGGGLANSRHAPKHQHHQQKQPPWAPRSGSLPPPATLAGNGKHEGNNNLASPSPTQELVRYTKIVRRLEWKVPFLDQGYLKATDRLGKSTAEVQNAEVMFKLDFFDFYALIERALVHLMGVFGIEISPTSNKTPEDGKLRSNYGYNHAYHANVLSALDDTKNPLHNILGTGEVRGFLHRAKELRNRWKSAGGILVSEENSSSSKKEGAIPPLEIYQLGKILPGILEGLDKAFVIAQRFVDTGRIEDEVRPLGDGDINMVDWSNAAAAAAGENVSSSEDLSNWNFITDAMDWEAV